MVKLTEQISLSFLESELLQNLIMTYLCIYETYYEDLYNFLNWIQVNHFTHCRL